MPSHTPAVLIALLLGMMPCGAARAEPAAFLCSARDSAANLAANGLRAHREAANLQDPLARTRLLEQAVRCYQLARQRSQVGGAKLYHPLGLAYEKLGRSAEAAAAFAAFLREVPETDRAPGLTAQTRAKLAALLPGLGQLDIEAPPGSELRVDDQIVGTAPLGHLLPVTPEVHVVTAAAPDQPLLTRTVTSAAGTSEVVALAPERGAAHVTPRAVVLKRWAIGTLAGTILLGGAGASLWALANRPTCGAPAGAVTCPDLFPPAGLGIGLAAGGAATLGVSITLFVLSRRAAREARSAYGPLRAQRTPSEADENESPTGSRTVATSEASP